MGANGSSSPQTLIMKVLHLHHGDVGAGGGQIQMLRLQAGLRAAGVDSKILCRVKSREDSVQLPPPSRFERLAGKVARRLGLNDVCRTSAFSLAESPDFLSADVLDIHCIHHDFFSYLALPTLTRMKPTVFTLHDMWPFTGHCHQSLDCDRWQSGCGSCPYLESAPAVARDATRWEWRLKENTFKRSRIVFISPSQWLASKFRQSMLRDYELEHIPHGIDTTVFRPLNKTESKKVMGIDPGKRVISFVVDDLGRSLKGGDLLAMALMNLPEKVRRRSVLLLMGRRGADLARVVDMESVDLGYVSQDPFKVITYSASDVFVLPTRTENSPLTVLESLACGTPVVSFAVGGVPEMVRSGETGLVAPPEDALRLSSLLCRVLEDRDLASNMGSNGRALVEREYSIERQVHSYVTVFERLLGSRTDARKVVA